MTIEEAKLVVENTLREWHYKDVKTTTDLVTIDLWATEEFGPRVAEISYLSKDRNSGSSYMQNDQPTGSLICYLVERYIISLMIGPNVDDWPLNHIEEAKEALRYALYKNLAL